MVNANYMSNYNCDIPFGNVGCIRAHNWQKYVLILPMMKTAKIE
jgi:hypothetical protein